MSPLSSSPSRRLVRRWLVATLAVLGGAALAPSAHAASVTYALNDPAGDNAGPKGLDFLNSSVVFDNTAGTVKVAIETAAPSKDLGGIVLLLGRTQGTDCIANGDETLFTMSFVSIVTKGSGALYDTSWALSGTDVQASVQETRSGGKINVAVGPVADLVGKSWDCATLQSLYETNPDTGDSGTADTVIAFAQPTGADAGPGPGTGTGTGTTPPKGTDPVVLRPPVKVTTTDLDTDGDGRADAVDVCPTVAGAAANGCPTMKPADEFRLGAKRVVVDRLVLRTAAECPGKVKIVVTSKGKTVGKGTFTVDQHGRYCRVNGIVRLKKRFSKVRVVAKGTGMAGTAKSVRR